MYLIISLTHTIRHEKYVTLWRPNNAGYCYSKDMAGVYESPDEGYHNNQDNMPILITEADNLFMNLPYNGSIRLMIPNDKVVWKKLGVKMTSDGLVRKKSYKSTIL